MSQRTIKYLICTLIGMLSMANTSTAAPYHQPDEAKELFQVEKIPLQVDSMKELAKHLIVIARRKQESSPANQRATGQLLAIAMRLDPANQDARETNISLKKGNLLDPSDDSMVKTAKSRLRFFTRWLAGPQAGADANQLANYLTDATKTLQAETMNNADLGNWTGVIPPIERYGKVRKQPEEDPKSPKNGRTSDPEGMNKNPKNGDSNKTPDPDLPPQPSSDFHLKEQTVYSPFSLFIREKYRDPKTPGRDLHRTKHFEQISRIKLTLKPCKADEKNRLVIENFAPASAKLSNGKDAPLLTDLKTTLYELLTSRHTSLPDYKSTVTISGGTYSISNKLAISAPLALMLEASISNKPLRPDLHICAEIDETGKLRQPDNFWQLLGELRKSQDGGRLIVTSATAELMIQVLVYGEPDFFTRWEVFSADTLDEALALSTKRSAEQLAEAAQLFDSVQNVARKTDVTKLAVNGSVRSRLANIVKLAPNHVSAKILLLQGSGKRPMRLSEKALAHELLPAIKDMNTALMDELNPTKLSTVSLKKIHESARVGIDKLDRLVDRSNDDLRQDALSLANDFRRLYIIAKRLAGNNSNSHDEKNARSLFYDMQRDSKDLHSRTLVAAGFPKPEESEEK